jgi:hypothetical protein
MNNLFVFTLFQEVLEIVTMFMDITTLHESDTCKHLKILGELFISLTNCWISCNSSSLVSTWFTNIITENNQEDSTRWVHGPENWSLTSVTNSASRIIFTQPMSHFTTVTWWHHYAETACENAYCRTHLPIVQFSVAEENKVNCGQNLMLVKCEDLWDVKWISTVMWHK